MSVRFPAGLVFAITPLAAFALAQAAPLKSVTLRYKFVPGQIQRYKIHMSQDSTVFTGLPAVPKLMASTTDMVVRQTVQSVRASDRAATLRGQIEDLHVFSQGKETPLPTNPLAPLKPSYTIVTLPTGRVVSFQMSGMAEPGKDFTGSKIVLPESPVKIGDSWTETAAAPVAGVQVTLTNTLTGFDHSGGSLRAIIQQKITGAIKKTITQGATTAMDLNGTVSGQGTYLFDIDAGTISSLACASKVTMILTPKPAPGISAEKIPKETKIEIRSQTTLSRLDTPRASSP